MFLNGPVNLVVVFVFQIKEIVIQDPSGIRMMQWRDVQVTRYQGTVPIARVNYIKFSLRNLFQVQNVFSLIIPNGDKLILQGTTCLQITVVGRWANYNSFIGLNFKYLVRLPITTVR